MDRLLIATHNPGKLEELRALLADAGLELMSPADMGLQLHVEEDGNTYIENASKKARSYAEASRLVTLADDSGLEVDALGGEPGLRSARYLAGSGVADADRRAYLLHRLGDKPRPWLARFRAAVAVATPTGSLRFAEGQCSGQVIPDERGKGGFGYDRIFLVDGTGLTMAELPMAEKNRISHRARAVMNAADLLRQAFAT